VALLGDTLHNAADALTAVPLLIAFRAVDPQLVGEATTAIFGVEGILDVPALRIRWIGHTLRAEVEVSVAAELSLAEAHDLAHRAETHLLTSIPRLTAATVHASPAGAH
jgi:divalent metal cation (Fe/Co/Zn/Cd) transporter